MLTIGSRGSALALAQSNWVREQILRQHPGIEIVIKIIKTSADRDTTTSIRDGSSTGVFVKEIEEALLAEEIDLAVHSMKDLPTKLPEALAISAVPPREDARDVLISSDDAGSLAELRRGCVIGTGSIRRQAQILALRPDVKVMDIRGNVDTRLQKLRSGSYDAVILACAGLNRLGLQNTIRVPLGFDEMLPAPGQGALALETRKDDSNVLPLIKGLNHAPTAIAVFAERAFLRTMGGGCNSPVAVLGTSEGDLIRVEGMVASPDGSQIIRDAVVQKSEEAESAGVTLAEKLLRDGGDTILHAI